MLLWVPVILAFMAVLYQIGMNRLEHVHRGFGESLEWAAATLTTTGSGVDVHWNSLLMQAFVITCQFAGQFLIFLVFPIFLLPFFEERFEARIPTSLPDLNGRVLIYRYGPAVTSLLEGLDQEKVPVVIFEENEAVARWLHERGRAVVLGDLEAEDPDLSGLVGARGLVVNGDDDHNAAMTLSARYYGFQGPIVAMVQDPARRPPMVRAGATAAYTPDHVLAAALAARASVKINPRVAGVRQLGRQLEVAELRIHRGSPLAGRSLAESRVRQETGAAVVGLWVGGELIRNPSPATRLDEGAIVVAVGSVDGIAALGRLATPVPQQGPFLVVGYGPVGRKLAEFLIDAGEQVRVVDAAAGEGVDVVGDPVDPNTLERAGARTAQAVVLTLPTDAAALFAAAVTRDLAPEVVIIAGANRAENVARIHRAGADFALSLSQVAGQLLSFQLLGEQAISLEAQIKIVSTSAGFMAGRPLAANRLLEQSGATVVAVERGETIVVDVGPDFVVQSGDVIYLCGTRETIAEYFREFPETRELPVPLRVPGLFKDT